MPWRFWLWPQRISDLADLTHRMSVFEARLEDLQISLQAFDERLRNAAARTDERRPSRE